MECLRTNLPPLDPIRLIDWRPDAPGRNTRERTRRVVLREHDTCAGGERKVTRGVELRVLNESTPRTATPRRAMPALTLRIDAGYVAPPTNAFLPAGRGSDSSSPHPTLLLRPFLFR